MKRKMLGVALALAIMTASAAPAVAHSERTGPRGPAAATVAGRTAPKPPTYPSSLDCDQVRALAEQLRQGLAQLETALAAALWEWVSTWTVGDVVALLEWLVNEAPSLDEIAQTLRDLAAELAELQQALVSLWDHIRAEHPRIADFVLNVVAQLRRLGREIDACLAQNA